MKIRYLPKHEVHFADHVLSGERWYYGEVKDIPDDAEIRLRRGNETLYINLIDDLLSNPDFKDAETGVNPLTLCDICGEETPVDYYQHRMSGTMVDNDFNGKRYCPQCFKQAETEGRLVIHPDKLEILEDSQ